MRLLTFLSAAACFIAVTAEARLGDTYRECTLRYRGVLPESKFLAELVPGAQHATFALPGWRIRVAFVKGVSVVQEYRKEANHPDGVSIRDEEIASILESEKGSGEWKPYKGSFTFNPKIAAQQFLATTLLPQWRRSDGAMASKSGLTFRVTSPAGLQSLGIAERQAEADRKARIPSF